MNPGLGQFLKTTIIPAMLLVSQCNAVEEDNGLQSHDNSQGFWLRTATVEAFVALEPQFRLLSVRRPGKNSVYADSTFAEQGIRLAFMEPEQIPASFDIGNQPAQILGRKTSTARVRLAAAGGLQYTVEVALDSTRPRVRLDYRLDNIGEKTRKIACWSVSSFGCEGKIVVPFDRKFRARRRLVLPWWSTWPQPGANFGRDTLVVDVSKEAVGNALKIGLISDCGWIAFLRDGEAVISTSPFALHETYPEDGANVSLFKSGAANQGRSETEQMGYLQNVNPGEALHFSETLDLFSIPTPLPEEADEVRKLIEHL